MALPDPFDTAPADRATVLLVDDNDHLREAVGSILAGLGFTPALAATGEEALAWLSEGLAPRLVILDMDMPGLGGAGTLPHIRNLAPDLPVVIATGKVDPQVHDLLRRFPGVSLMPKPYGLQELRARLA